MKKALIVSTVSGFVPQFEMNNIKILQSMGYEVHYASNFNNPSYGDNNDRLDNTGIVLKQVDFIRTPFSFKNFKVYQQLQNIMLQNQYDIIHCHTPMGGVMSRLAARKFRKKGLQLIYTAHGFHFFKGVPLVNWLFYYPVEWLLSFFTDILICINKEDFSLAKKYFHSKKTFYVPGVGIDYNKIIQEDRANLKEELGIDSDQIIVVTVAELNKGKNIQTLLKTHSYLTNDKISYVICGQGIELENLRKLVQNLNAENNVYFLGYREDVIKIIKDADIFAFPSLREGLPRSLMEAMACGLPVICTEIRGNKDLIDSSGGILLKVNHDLVQEMAKAILILSEDRSLRESFGRYNQKNAEQYDIRYIGELMEKIYSLID